jgi:hypothetical protein
MAIYRGEGGAGDATADASNAAALADAFADAANASAGQAATSAAAAEAAKLAAEAAQTAAELAETNAETAEANAEAVLTDAGFIVVAADLQGTDTIGTVATDIANVNAVGNNIANVNTVAGISADVTAVAGDATDIGTVAASITDVNDVAANITDVIAVADNETNIDTVAANNANITTVAGISANVTTVAGISANVTTVATNDTNVTTVATNIANVNAVGTNIANVNSVAGNATNINTVAGINANVTTVAGISGNVTTVATNNANVTTVAGSIANVNTNATNIANINQNAANIVAIQNASANATAAASSATAAAGSATSASASAAAASAVALGNEPVRHSVRPSLLLDFANTKTLDPRITFTRASTASFYDGKTVAKAEENLVLHSQEFDNASWEKVNATVTANSVASPDGTTTAESLLETVDNNAHYVTQTITLGAVAYTFSCFIKANGRNYAFISHAGTNVVSVDLAAGTASLATGSPSNITCVETPTGSGWYRVGFTFTPSAGSTSVRVWASTDGVWANRNYVGDITKGLYIWGAQLEQRSSVTAYTPTTTERITNYIPALQTAASGVARFEHNPITGESLGLEIEEQRVNLLTYSSEFDNATWSKTALTLYPNLGIAPDGTQSADLVVYTGAGAIRTAEITITAVPHTISFYVKKRIGSFFTIRAAFFTTNFGVGFDLDAVTAQSGGSITHVGNGWYRCSVTWTPSGPDLSGFFFTYLPGTLGGFDSVAGNESLIWGAQLEAGAFATSYIPTVASQVTRSADAASMTGTNFSSWYRQGVGSVFGSGTRLPPSGTGRLFAISDNTNNNRIDYVTATSTTSQPTVVTNGVVVADLSPGGWTVGSRTLIATAFETDNYRTSRSGASVASDTSGVIPVVDRLYIGAGATGIAYLNGYIQKLAYYPIALTSAELQGLTTN